MGEININVTTMGITLDQLVSQKATNAIQLAITTSLALVKDKWQSEVQHQLHSTIPLYLQGLDFNSVVYPFGNDVFSGAVVLNGQLPNMLESGFAAFDEKVGFSKSSKKHTSKDGGWYLTIPLRHSTPGSFMYGPPMTDQIYSQAKLLANRQHLTIKGGQKTSWTGYVHKNNIYDGLTRVIKSYSNSNAKQSQYFTFRRVSNKSDKKSWWHPGYSGVKISDTLEPYAMKIFKKELEKNLVAMLSN